MNSPKDFPLKQVLLSVSGLISRGGVCYQKWTCDGCGERLTSETPNFFTIKGTCECGAVTDIDKKGCNYLLAFQVDSSKIEEAIEKMGLKPEAKDHIKVVKLP